MRKTLILVPQIEIESPATEQNSPEAGATKPKYKKEAFYADAALKPLARRLHRARLFPDMILTSNDANSQRTAGHIRDEFLRLCGRAVSIETDPFIRPGKGFVSIFLGSIRELDDMDDKKIGDKETTNKAEAFEKIGRLKEGAELPFSEINTLDKPATGPHVVLAVIDQELVQSAIQYLIDGPIQPGVAAITNRTWASLSRSGLNTCSLV